MSVEMCTHLTLKFKDTTNMFTVSLHNETEEYVVNLSLMQMAEFISAALKVYEEHTHEEVQ